MALKQIPDTHLHGQRSAPPPREKPRRGEVGDSAALPEGGLQSGQQKAVHLITSQTPPRPQGLVFSVEWMMTLAQCFCEDFDHIQAKLKM